MGRSIPTDETDLLIHPVLSFSLIAAGMAATIAMITALCSFRRKPPRNVEEDIPQSPASKTKELDSSLVDVVDVKTTEAEAEAEAEAAATTTTTAMSETATTVPQESETDDKEKEDGADFKSKELPLPPGKKALGLGADKTTNSCNASNADTTPSQIKKSASERRLLSNLSIKLPRSLSMAKKGEKVKEEYNKRKNGKLSMAKAAKQEDTIWMKTIILGEKCRVPDDDELVIYDAKGRRIPAYHPKSRQNSFIDPTAIPNQIKSRQCSFIDPGATPDQKAINVEIIDQNKIDGHQQEMDADQQELMSLSQI